MTNLAFNFTFNSGTSSSHNATFQVHKDTLVFDGNSKTAHLIARTLLINDPSQKFSLMPKQNSHFFGIDIPEEYLHEKFLLIGTNGEVKRGKQALDHMSEKLNLDKMYH